MVMVYTIQMARHRKATAQDIVIVDITVKSGDPVFAPEWQWVMDVKSGKLSEEGYTRLYREKMLATRSTVNIGYVCLNGKR